MLKKLFSSDKKKDKYLKDNLIKVETGVHLDIAKVKLGKYIFIAKNTLVGPNCSNIGSFVSIATDCVIGPNNHPIDKLSTSAIFYSSSWGFVSKADDMRQFHNSQKDKVEIGNDVWIGTKAVILTGCRIGDGAVIAAGSVVTKNVEPYAIYGGVPAKLIKYRFEPEIVAELLRIKWWELPVQDVLEHYNLPITEFIAAMKTKVEL